MISNSSNPSGSLMRQRSDNSVALVTSNRTWTVKELLAVSKAIEGRLQQQLKTSNGGGTVKGHRIILPSSDPARFLAGLFACFEAGISVVPWRDTSLPLEVVSKTASADLLLRFEDANPHDVEVLPTGIPFCDTGADGDLIMMTSGSTGTPKGVVISPHQIIENSMSAGTELGVDACDAWSVEIDMALMSATCHAIMAWQFDLPLYHLAAFTEEEYRTKFKSKKMGFGGSPVQLLRLCEKLGPDEAPAMLVSSGDFFTPPMIEKLARHFPETSINKLYGLTELSGRFCCNVHKDLMQNKPAAGKPLTGFRARVSPDTPKGEAGEIEASSPMVFRGYLRNDGKFHPLDKEWFGTGDIGNIDENGFVTVIGRKDDVLKVGGLKVDRHSIEQALSQLIKPHEFCVLGVKHPLLGQCLALFIAVPDGTIEPPSWAEIVRQVKSELPSRYVPALMYRLDKPLPRLANGKINAVSLKEQHSGFKRLS